MTFESLVYDWLEMAIIHEVQEPTHLRSDRNDTPSTYSELEPSRCTDSYVHDLCYDASWSRPLFADLRLLKASTDEITEGHWTCVQ